MYPDGSMLFIIGPEKVKMLCLGRKESVKFFKGRAVSGKTSPPFLPSWEGPEIKPPGAGSQERSSEIRKVK